MRIAFITAATFTIPWFREDMLKEFRRRGHDVVVFGNEDTPEWVEYFRKLDVRYRTYPVLRNGLSPKEDIETFRALKKLLAEERPDRVLTNFAKANIYGCRAAHSAGLKNMYVMMGGLGSVFHGSDLKSKIARPIVSMQYKRALKYAEKVFFQNDEDSALLLGLGLVKQDQIVRINGSGVNVSHYEFERIPDAPAFVFIGRLVRGKGVMDYLDAARLVKALRPEVVFNLVGPFDTNPSALTEEDIKPYVEDGTVVFHGPQRDVRPFLRDATAFVLPSYYGEGTPKSALEAMATGRPLIVADAVGCREVVREGVNGFLVSPRDSGAIADAMLRLVEEDGLAARMGVESRKMAEEMFDVRKVNAVICDAMELECD